MAATMPNYMLSTDNIERTSSSSACLMQSGQTGTLKLECLLRDLYVKNCVFVADMQELIENGEINNGTRQIITELHMLHSRLPHGVQGLQQWISTVAPLYHRYASTYVFDPMLSEKEAYLRSRPIDYLSQLAKRIVTIEFELLTSIGSSKLQEIVQFTRDRLHDDMDNVHHHSYDFTHVRDFDTLQYTKAWFDPSRITQSANFDFELHHSLGSIGKTAVQILILDEEDCLTLAICSVSRSPSLIFPPFKQTDLIFDRKNSTSNCLILTCRCCCVSRKKIFLFSAFDTKVRAWNWKLSRLFRSSKGELPFTSIDSVGSGLGIEFDASNSQIEHSNDLSGSELVSSKSMNRLSVPLTPSLSEQLKDYLSADTTGQFKETDIEAADISDFAICDKENLMSPPIHLPDFDIPMMDDTSKDFSCSTLSSSSTSTRRSSASEVITPHKDEHDFVIPDLVSTHLSMESTHPLIPTAPLAFKPRMKDLQISQKLAMAISSRDVLSSTESRRKSCHPFYSNSSDTVQMRTGYLPRSRSDNDAVLSTVLEQSPSLEQEEEEEEPRKLLVQRKPVKVDFASEIRSQVGCEAGDTEKKSSRGASADVEGHVLEPNDAKVFDSSCTTQPKLRVKNFVKRVRRLMSREKIKFELIDSAQTAAGAEEQTVNHHGIVERKSSQGQRSEAKQDHPIATIGLAVNRSESVSGLEPDFIHDPVLEQEDEKPVAPVQARNLEKMFSRAGDRKTPADKWVRRRSNSLTPSIASCDISQNSTTETGIKSSMSMNSLHRSNTHSAAGSTSSAPSMRFPVFTGTGVVSEWNNGCWKAFNEEHREVLVEVFSSGQLVFGGTSIKLQITCDVRRSTMQDIEVKNGNKTFMIRFAAGESAEQFINSILAWKSNCAPVSSTSTVRPQLHKSQSTPSFYDRNSSLGSLSSAMVNSISSSSVESNRHRSLALQPLLPPIISSKNGADPDSPTDLMIPRTCSTPPMEIQTKYFRQHDGLLLLNNLRCRYMNGCEASQWSADNTVVRMSIQSEPGSFRKTIFFRNIGCEKIFTSVEGVQPAMCRRSGKVVIIVEKDDERYTIQCKGEKEAKHVFELLQEQ